MSHSDTVEVRATVRVVCSCYAERGFGLCPKCRGQGSYALVPWPRHWQPHPGPLSSDGDRQPPYADLIVTLK
jgi:hypothetical protein